MASPNTAAPIGLKRQRDSLKCDTCREKKRKCHPHNRDWLRGEKCEPCQIGGQDCGPDVRRPRNAGAGGTIPHNSELAPLLSLMPKTNPHPAPLNAGVDQDLLVMNIIPTSEGLSATRLGPGSQSQVADSKSAAESIVSLNSRLSTIDRRSEDCDDAPKCFTRLCELRIILEDLRSLQSPSLPPSDSQDAIKIEHGLRYIVSQTSRAFKETLEKLLKIAANIDTTNAKLIYLQAVGVIEAINGDRKEYSTLRANALSRLISIYEEEENWGAAILQLQELATLQRHGKTGSVPDASSKMAECSQKISAKFGKVLDACKIAIEDPLHVNSETPFPPLLRALWGGHDEVTRILCNTPAALEGRDMRRQNALMVAAAIGKVHLLKSAFPGNPNLLTDRDVLNRQPLVYAAHHGDFNSFLVLAEAGANFKDRDASGRSILRVAAISGSARIVEYLLKQGISPNEDILRESSALHDAAKRGRWTICKLLLSKGALANDRFPADGVSRVHKTPYEVAKDNGFPDLASMIEKAASRPMNDITHPMNDVVHQEYSQANDPNHVAEMQSTHTASAAQTHDDSTDAPISLTQPHPVIQQVTEVDQHTPTDHYYDGPYNTTHDLDDLDHINDLNDLNDLVDLDYASLLLLDASVHAPEQNYEAQQ